MFKQPCRFNRSRFVAFLALLTSSFILNIIVTSRAVADAPDKAGYNPGHYRIMLGEFEITALSDGTVPVPIAKIMKGVESEEIETALTNARLPATMEMSVNSYLVNTGNKLILIDAGAGTFMEGSGGSLNNLVENIKASGYRPEQIDEIYLTHMHLDHVGGILKDGKAVFTNAIVRAHQSEADQWLSQVSMGKAAPVDKVTFKGALEALSPYVNAGRFEPFNGAVELTTGISSLPTPGHMNR